MLNIYEPICENYWRWTMLNIFYDPICENDSFETHMPELEKLPNTMYEL